MYGSMKPRLLTMKSCFLGLFGSTSSTLKTLPLSLLRLIYGVRWPCMFLGNEIKCCINWSPGIQINPRNLYQWNQGRSLQLIMSISKTWVVTPEVILGWSGSTRDPQAHLWTIEEHQPGSGMLTSTQFLEVSHTRRVVWRGRSWIQGSGNNRRGSSFPREYLRVLETTTLLHCKKPGVSQILYVWIWTLLFVFIVNTPLPPLRTPQKIPRTPQRKPG